MVSGLLLLVVWWAVVVLLRKLARFGPSELVLMGFITALALLGLGSLAFIEFTDTGQFRLHLLAILLSGFAFLAVERREARQGLAALGTLLDLQPDNLPPRELGSIRTVAVVRQILTVVFIAILVLICGLDSGPVNWDSHTYNLARVPAMISSGTVFLEETGSLRQAVYPLGHDLLYYPDIAFGNLRGLGLICAFQAVLLLGALFQLTRLVVDDLPSSPPRRVAVREVSLLLVLCLFIASDQQIFQSIATKNDLVLVLLFVVALLLSLLRCLGRLRIRDPELAGCLLLIGATGLAAKSYGPIVILPVVVCGAIAWVRRLRLSPEAELPADAALRAPSPVGRSSLPLLVLLGLLSLALVLVQVRLQVHTAQFHAGPALREVTTDWTNTSGALGTRLARTGLNVFRALVSLFAYPYSTFLKPDARGPDDYWMGLGPLAGLVNSSFGIAPRSTFQLVRRASLDSAYTSPLFSLFLLILGAAAFAGFLRRLRGQPCRDREAEVGGFPTMAAIVIASLSALLALSGAVLYQSWISRFLGAAYVPLFPVLAAGVANVVLPRRWPGRQDGGARFALPAILAVIAAMATIRMATILDLPAAIPWPASLPQVREQMAWRQFPYRMYFEYLASHRISPVQGNRLLAQLRELPYERRVICYQEDVPSLVPLLAAIENPEHSLRPTRLLSQQGCDQLRKGLTPLEQKQVGVEGPVRRGQTLLFFLP